MWTTCVVARLTFQFTHPGRGATLLMLILMLLRLVSIHAPREGCDIKPARANRRRSRVSIHAPREGCDILKWEFRNIKPLVSIHAPREGCDICKISLFLLKSSFNSRTPGGVRLDSIFSVRFDGTVSIHAPREGCDSGWTCCSSDAYCFNSRTPGGVRLTMV